MDERLQHIKRFYLLMESLQERIHGSRLLAECTAAMRWPKRGVYFLMEEGEGRSDSGNGPRVVRIGTHALNLRSSAKLWTRLSQHRGQKGSRNGNHRGSIFRLIVGASLISRHHYQVPTWGQGGSATADTRAKEKALEKEVSRVIGEMSVLWLSLEDEPGPKSLRAYIERNSIALLSNYNKTPLDPPSSTWLGNDCQREGVRKSGLWNSNHVDEPYDPQFLGVLDNFIFNMPLM